MTEQTSAAPQPEIYQCPNRPLNLHVTAKGMPTHAPCPSTWLCAQKGCQLNPAKLPEAAEKSLFESVFGGRW